MSTTPSWHQRLLGGFKRTSDRLVGNLAGLGTARLDEDTLDEIEEALIASDLGPATAARIRARLAEGSFERDMEELGIRLVVAEEIEKTLEKVAKPLEIEAFPRPQVILVIGVNGSGKTTTIAKLAHLLHGAGLRRDAGRRRHVPRRGDRPAPDLGRPRRRSSWSRGPRAATRRGSCSKRSSARPTRASTR